VRCFWRSGGQLRQRVALAGGDPEQRRDQRHRGLEPVCAARQERLKLVDLSRRRVVAREAGGALQLCDHRVERTGLVIRRALAEQVEVGLALELCAQLAHDPGFANPGLAR
jgi:hypothetical protein